ncbi:DUF7408 domain-containing protein [Paenibacillus sanguinis]|uniref:DUF7408 domain-containing protein n=1 Tax=Paenibacillus sanguinis TaxID=225906 RepID=UPI0012B569AC|nr:hypothetical protein [Paenibacillus sanguinis]
MLLSIWNQFRPAGLMLKVASILLTACLLLGISAPLTVQAAEPKLTVESELGYGGKIAMNEWGPLSVKLLSDKDISGELVVETASPFTGTSSSYIERVDLSAGEAKTVQFAVLGNNYGKDNSSIEFYEGTAEQGKYIPFSTGRAYIQGSAVNSLMIGVLAADPDTLNFMTSSGNKQNALVTPLAKEQVPEDAVLLSTLDVIVLNNYASDTLSEKQIESLHHWVKQGGSLVLAGGQGYAKTAKGFEDIAPVEYKGGTDVKELTAFSRTTGEPLKLAEPFPVSSAVVKEGAKSVMSSDGVPMVATQSVGKGNAIYVAYDISMDPVYHWRGHADLWTKILRADFMGTGTLYGGESQWNLMSGLSYALDYFPSLTPPPFSLLFWMLVLYAILVAPLLYFVLKKLDRREWAWGLMPLIAVIASVSIYLAGTSGRGDIRAHTLNIIELDGQGEAVKSASSALFVPRGGNYQVELPAGTRVLVEREGNLLGGQASGADRQLLRVNAEATELTLREMTPRSMAKLWMERPESLSTGQLQIDVSVDSQGKLQGTVRNETSSDLEDAYLVAASQIYALGKLPRGDEVQLPATFTSVGNRSYGDLIFPYTGHSRSSSDERERERAMIDQYIEASGSNGRYALLAWSKEAPDQGDGYMVNGKQRQTDYLNLWAQPFKPSFKLNGQVDIPFGMILPDIVSNTATEMYWERSNYINMSEGELILEFVLPADERIEYQEIQVRSSFPNNSKMQVWNEHKGQWEAGITEAAEQYIQGGTVKVKYITTEWTSFQLPEIMLKGRLAP